MKGGEGRKGMKEGRNEGSNGRKGRKEGRKVAGRQEGVCM